MGAELVKVPDYTGWRLNEVWDLRDSLEGATQELDAYIDDQIKYLAGEGWTQKAIAEECHRSQQAISKRMARLEIEPSAPSGRTGRPRLTTGGKSDEEPPEAEVIDGEPVIDEIPVPDPPSTKPDPEDEDVSVPVGVRKTKQQKKLLTAAWQYADYLSSVYERMEPEVLKTTLPEGDLEECLRSLRNARTVLTRILAAL